MALVVSAPQPRASSGSRAREWIAQLESAASDARRACAGQSRTLMLAGTAIAIEAIGPAILPWLQPALGHALGEPAAIDPIGLTIWDQASTGVAPPPPFWDEGGWANRGELPALAEDGVIAAYHEHAGYLAIFDTHRRRAWVWVRDAAAVPRYERAAPLRGPLSWLLAAEGGQLAHAGAVATTEGAALLAGPGGSGKSTTALACLAAGLRFLGDDYVLMHPDAAGPPRVHLLYASAKLTESSLDLLPRLRPLADGPGTPDDKAMLPLAGPGIATAAPLVATILPRIGSESASRWEPAPAARALTALAPTTLFQLPGAGAQSLARLAAVARAVPAFTLNLGRDMDDVAHAVRAIIAEAAGSAA